MRWTLAAIPLLLAASLLAQEGKEDPREQEAVDSLNKAVERLQSADKEKDPEAKKKASEEVLASLRDLAAKYRECRAWGMMQFDVGVVLCDYLQRYDDAIPEFRALVESKVDDKDPTGMLMSPYRNYRYHAWRMISTCEEKRGKPAHAVDACLSMRKAYVTHCGT